MVMKKGVTLLIIGILILGVLGTVYADRSEKSDSSSDSSDSEGSSSDSKKEKKSSSGGDDKDEDEKETSSGNGHKERERSKKIKQEMKKKKKEMEKLSKSIKKSHNKIKVVSLEEEDSSEDEEKDGHEKKFKQRFGLGDSEVVSEVKLKISKDSWKIKAELSNGEKEEIKIMPNVASKIALAKLKTKNQFLELKEVGKGDDARIIYLAEANKTARVLGMFKAKYKLKIEIDSENGKILKKHLPWWYFLVSDELEDPEVENTTLQLIRPIQDIVLVGMQKEIIDLDTYFLNAESYSVSLAENISFVLEENLLTLFSEENFTGNAFVKIMAQNGDENLEVGFNVLVSEGNLSVQTFQYPAILGEKVRWKKTILAGDKAVKINLPWFAENITLFKLSNGVIVEKEEIHKKSLTIKKEKEIDSYEIEYYTPAPSFFEERGLFTNRKKVKVHGPEDLLYSDVLAFDYLPLEAEAKAVKLYAITSNGKEEIKVSKHDLNKNGLVDYIEWVIPLLNNQTYEVIIEIAGADHLDSARNFISDIYEEVYQLDGVWSEEIPSQDYVRVTFQAKLDNTRDIKIYPKVISGDPRIEVYEADGNEIIAELPTVNSNTYNQILLTNLVGTQDTFDLRIVGGDLEIDHIVDPAVTLVSPFDNTYSSNPTQTFTCSATDDILLSNITLYGSWAGGWHANETVEVTGVSNSTSFIKTLSDGAYIWNCLAYDNDSNAAWAISNYSIVIDTLFPEINITFPQNQTYNYAVSGLNYSYSEDNPDVCWYSTNSGITNSTPVSCGTGWTGVSSTEGTNIWTVYINDSTGSENLTSVVFMQDSLYPQINYGAGTAVDYANLSQSNVYVDVEVVEANEDTIIFSLYNASGIVNQSSFTDGTRAINWIDLADGTYTYNVTINDSLGNSNITLTRTITLDTSFPLISFGVGTAVNYANLSQNWTYVNVSTGEGSLANMAFSLYKGGAVVNSTLYTSVNYEIKWISLEDGIYSYEVNITDIAGNKNSTGLRYITLDTHVPEVSISCSKSLLAVGESLTCTCDVTDNLDSSPSIDYTETPVTSRAGSFTTTCTATDFTGNSASDDFNYEVESSGGGSYPNYPVPVLDLSKGYSQVLRKNWKMNFKLDDKKYTLLVKEIKDNETTIVLSPADSQEESLEVGEARKFELSGDDYYDFLVKVNSIKKSLLFSSVNLTVQSINEKIAKEESFEDEKPEKIEDSKSEGWFERLINWIKNLFS